MDGLLRRRVRAVWVDDGRTKSVVGILVEASDIGLLIKAERENNHILVGKAGLISVKEEPETQRTLRDG